VDLRLQGLNAVVTGGTKGIGRAIVETLLTEGARVAFCARHGAEVAQVQAELSAGSAKVRGHALDVRDGDALKAWVAEVNGEFGGIDIVIANVSALAISHDEAAWRNGFEVDLMGTVRLVDAAMPSLEKSAHAALVTIASVSAREIDFASGPYGAFKAAIVHYTRCLAFETRKSHVRVNCVSPGATATARFLATRKIDAAYLRDEGTFERYGAPRDQANAVAFLCTPAARFIHGQVLRVDGGLTLYAG